MGLIDSIQNVFTKTIETITGSAGKGKPAPVEDKKSETALPKTDENEAVEVSELQDDTKTGSWKEFSEKKAKLDKIMNLIQEKQVIIAKLHQFASNPSSMTADEYNQSLIRLKEIDTELETLKLEIKVDETKKEIKDVESAIEQEIKSETPKLS